jgi:hypothetical protein
MSFNILNAVVHGAESFLMSGGNPVAAGIGAVEGGIAPAQPQPQMEPDLLAELNSLSNYSKTGAV